MATTAGALLSDHVNYLILRYLQECGHDATARSFYHDWYRPSAYRDPEELPFASHVQRAALISVIQDGIKFDDLQDHVPGDSQKRHGWSQMAARHPHSHTKPAVNGLESQHGKRKSVTAVGTHSDDVHPPLPKRQRTLPEDNARINGHRYAVDMDERSPSAMIEDDEDADAISPALVSEPEGPRIRYDSATTQTDLATRKQPPRPALRQRSFRFAVDKPNSNLFHAAWNPSKQPKDRRTLITTGENLCRLYKIPERLNDTTAGLPHVDEPSIAESSMITAAAWHPSGRVVTCAVDTIATEDELSRRPMKRSLIDIGPDLGGTISHLDSTALLQPPGIVLAIEYSPSGEHLLVASTNTKRSLVQVWSTPNDDSGTLNRAEPIAWCFFERELTDVAWCEDLQIRACTASNQASILMLPEQLETMTEFTPSTVRRHNFIEEVLTLPSVPIDTTITYKYDNSHWIDLFFVQHAGRQQPATMVVLDLKHHDASNVEDRPLSFALQQDFTVAELQPEAKIEDTNGEVKSLRSSSRLLAVAFESGDCQIYELGRTNDKMSCKPLFDQSGCSLRMSRGPILAAAWSPSGAHLALAGSDQVQVWSAERTESDLLDERSVLTWNAGPAAPRVNGSRHDEPRHASLSWDAPGEKLCFVVDNEISIIELEQSPTDNPDVMMDGS